MSDFDIYIYILLDDRVFMDRDHRKKKGGTD